MANYEFMACDYKLPSFQEALEEEEIQSYNGLLKLGFTQEQIAYSFRGIDLKGIDRDKKVFLIQLPEELQNSPVEIIEDFHNPYARYLSDKKYIYKINGVNQALPHFIGYIAKYVEYWKELELWRVVEDDYRVYDVPAKMLKLRDHTLLNHLDVFYEGPIPQQLVLLRG